jgi:hypothetical protein
MDIIEMLAEGIGKNVWASACRHEWRHSTLEACATKSAAETAARDMRGRFVAEACGARFRSATF